MRSHLDRRDAERTAGVECKKKKWTGNKFMSKDYSAIIVHRGTLLLTERWSATLRNLFVWNKAGLRGGQPREVRKKLHLPTSDKQLPDTVKLLRWVASMVRADAETLRRFMWETIKPFHCQEQMHKIHLCDLYIGYNTVSVFCINSVSPIICLFCNRFKIKYIFGIMVIFLNLVILFL